MLLYFLFLIFVVFELSLLVGSICWLLCWDWSSLCWVFIFIFISICVGL